MTTEVKRSELLKVPFALIELVEGLNIREDYGDIKELAESIRENGIKIPLRGFKKRGEEIYCVVDGHRRYKAAELLVNEGVEIIVPFLLQEKGTGEEQQIVDMFITNEGKPLTPVEQAEGVARLINHGWEAKEIALKIAKSATYVNNLFLLYNAPKKAKTLIKKGTVSATFIISRIKDETLEEFLVDVDGWLAENGEDENGTTDTGKGKKKKAAKITRKDFVQNSVKEFKKFAKSFHETFPDKETEKVYLFVSSMVSNELSYEQILNYFNDGTAVDSASKGQVKKLRKKADVKPAAKKTKKETTNEAAA